MPPKVNDNNEAKKAARRERRRRARERRRADPNRAAMAPVKREINTYSGNALTRLMMLPCESDLVRLPTADAPPVAITKLQQVRTFKESGADDSYGGFNYVAITYGQPSLTHMDGPYTYTAGGNVMLQYIQAAVSLGGGGSDVKVPSYEWEYNIPGSGIAFSLEDDVATPFVDRDGVVVPRAVTASLDLDDWWPLVSAIQTVGLPRRPILVEDGIPYVWINAGEEIVVGGGSAIGGASGTGWLGVYRLQEESLQPVCVGKDTFTWSAGTISNKNFGWQLSGWYALKAEGVLLVSGTLNRLAPMVYISYKATYKYWQLNYPPEVASTPDLAQSARRTACSLLVSNRASALIAQGNVLAARLHTSFPGTRESKTMWDDLLAAENKYTGNAAQGCYTYMEFAHQDEEFGDYINEWGNPICRYPRGTMMNVITISNTSGQSNVYSITSTIVMEFMTSSQLFPKAVSLQPYTELIDARRINNMTTYFYENSLHWKDLSRYIAQVWDWTRRHGTLLGSAASVLFPEASPVIMPVARMLQR